MVYEIVYTPQFEEDFMILMDYLSEKWSDRIAKQFGSQLDDLIVTLSKMPFIGKKSLQNLLVRGITVTDKNILYYAVLDNQIVLLSLVDTRQDS
ncbi:MAG: type II toxin-antitoxin system RelE/ParE family toxin [Arcicella sp.]|nr:type II toxin-antitoxin system RelE/ParE family toxin [Arcicella sp.]